MPNTPRRHPFRGHLPLEHETALYLLASVLDVAMTMVLLYRGAGGGGGAVFVESNPVARFFLDRWGPRGMVYFKFTMVAFVCVIVQVIATRRPETARVLLRLATAVVVAVVIYSVLLLVRHG